MNEYLKLSECIKSGLHLTDCDNDGFCNHCGYQDNDKNQYVISENISDHVGYTGEVVMIVQKLPNDYVIVENSNGTQWQCGIEELKLNKK